MNYHPDRGGSTEMMQAVNAAYAMVKDFSGTVDTTGAQVGYGEALNEAINAIITCPGLVIEVCGIWVWVSGDTRYLKETLKAASYRWASKKHQWYFRPEGWSGGRGKSTMDDIRAKYGSSTVKTQFATALTTRRCRRRPATWAATVPEEATHKLYTIPANIS